MKTACLVLKFEYARRSVPLSCDLVYVYEVERAAEGSGNLLAPDVRRVEMLRLSDGQLVAAVTTRSGEALIPEPDELAQALRMLRGDQEQRIATLRAEVEREEGRLAQLRTLLTQVCPCDGGPYRSPS